MIITLAIIAGVLPASLTAAQKRELAHALVCPNHLSDDTARIANTDHFMKMYLRFAPHSRAGERMVVRDEILNSKKCRDDIPLQHTYPET